ncbi:MAG TPA: SMI1/KNR4 family protein [Leptolyngbyaceae cyanobacterium]
MLENWQALLAQLKVFESDESQEIWQPEQLKLFELETGIILPEQYKEFCQVFGTGMFGDYMRIYCPNIYMSNLFINSVKDDVNNFPDPSHGKIMDVESLKKLLEFAFMFGDNPSSDIVFWDLSSYSKSDDSYDIYIANSDCFAGDIHKIGRNFYEFIRDFCLGTRSYELLPESMRPAPQELTLTFYPFNSKSESIDSDSWMQNRLIWQKNIASGVVRKMAQNYEDRGHLQEALLLHIQHLKIAGTFGLEANFSFTKLKELLDTIGEQKIRAICQASDYPPEELLLFITLVNTNLTSKANAKQQFEHLDAENLPDPDAEFQQVWQDFLQSARERLETEQLSFGT